MCKTNINNENNPYSGGNPRNPTFTTIYKTFSAGENRLLINPKLMRKKYL